MSFDLYTEVNHAQAQDRFDELNAKGILNLTKKELKELRGLIKALQIEPLDSEELGNIKVKVYYSYDMETNKILIDDESIKDELNEALKRIKEVFEE